MRTLLGDKFLRSIVRELLYMAAWLYLSSYFLLFSGGIYKLLFFNVIKSLFYILGARGSKLKYMKKLDKVSEKNDVRKRLEFDMKLMREFIQCTKMK